jgi:hypothetical protein
MLAVAGLFAGAGEPTAVFAVLAAGGPDEFHDNPWAPTFFDDVVNRGHARVTEPARRVA